ncbi:MAG: DUF1800 family protein [Planctomycetota bacterium]|nr:DUF1800 family protein [Planctomycetota bacterium]
MQHFSVRTMVEVGRSRVIAFGVVDPASHDRTLECSVSDPQIVTILREPEVLADRSIGYVRVKGLAPGTIDLKIGTQSIELEVVPPRAGTISRSQEPRIIGPVSGASVWDTISIGVETGCYGIQHQPAIQLELPDGSRLDPVEDSGDSRPPNRQLRFELDLTDHESGILVVTPIAVMTDGHERPGQAVRLQVVHPSPDQLIEGEAEAIQDVERPQRFRDDRRHIGRDRKASGGAYFTNASSNPALCIPVQVEQSGRYQVMLTASGTSAQGALPTVGIVLDGSNVSTTNGRLLSKDWHRLAIGIPIHLEAGAHVITPLFANDFYVPGLADRNLFLDRFEILRLEGGNDEASKPGDTMNMMAPSMMGASMMSTTDAIDSAARVIDDPTGLEASVLRLGFTRLLDGGTIAGVIEIEGRCWWMGQNQIPAPRVTLFINDEPVMEQRSGAPRFWVDAGFFKAGANRIQMVATMDSGVTVRTPVQVMYRSAEADAMTPRPARRHHRFSIHDERWIEGVQGILRNHLNPKERRAAVLSSNGELVLELPESLEGNHKIFLEARGELFEGSPIAALTLRQGEVVTPIGEQQIGAWWQDKIIAEFVFPPGPKQLVVAFTNDHYIKDKGDRNLLVQAVILARNPDAENRMPPIVEILYPPDGHEVYMADAIVGWAADDTSLANVELILDGVSTGLNTQLALRSGDVVLPLPLRQVEPGEHTIALQATDTTGNLMRSEPRTIMVLEGPPQTPGPYERAIHLLNRLAYGPDHHELKEILILGEQAWLDARLDQPFEHEGDLISLGMGLSSFVNTNNYEVPRRAISHALKTPNPVRARFVFWAENHFSTWIQKIQGHRKWREHIAFSRLGFARFDDLLFASAHSPAMLAYLDQERSFAGQLNENYAREIMELHTLGVHGGYDQQDVTNLAQLLTGWTSSFEGDGVGGGQAAQRYTFRFDPRLNDTSSTRVLGMQFDEASPSDRYDRTRLALELLAAHPNTAKFVCKKLAQHYMAYSVTEELVDDLTEVYHETGGDLAMVIRALVAHDAFWIDLSPLRVATAQDYALRLCRTSNNYHPWAVGDFLLRSGFGLYDCATPDGYPEEDIEQTDSNAMTQRWRLARDLRGPLAGLVPNGWRYNRNLPENIWSQQVIDVIAIRLTGRVLGEASNEAALQLLSKTQGNRNQRVQLIAPFIAQLPEVNLR